MSQLRLDIRTRVRDYLYESVADLWSDTQLNRLINEELLSLPRKNIYLEEIWTTPQVVDQRDYTLPTGTIKVELLERNESSSNVADWKEIKGWDNYAGALFLPYNPSDTKTIRGFIRKQFTVPTDDITAMDIPDDKSEVLVWGIVIRCYRILIGYLRGDNSWDAVTKPGNYDIGVIKEWLKDAKAEYNSQLLIYATNPKPQDIDLVS